MFADALDRLGDEDEVDRRRDGARIFHHVGDQLAHQAVELLVDLVVVPMTSSAFTDVEPGEASERLAQLRRWRGGLEGDVATGGAGSTRRC